MFLGHRGQFLGHIFVYVTLTEILTFYYCYSLQLSKLTYRLKPKSAPASMGMQNLELHSHFNVLKLSGSQMYYTISVSEILAGAQHWSL